MKNQTSQAALSLSNFSVISAIMSAIVVSVASLYLYGMILKAGVIYLFSLFSIFSFLPLALVVSLLYSRRNKASGPRVVYTLVGAIVFFVGWGIFDASNTGYYGTGGGILFATAGFFTIWLVAWIGGLTKTLKSNMVVIGIATVFLLVTLSGLGFILLSLSYGLRAKDSRMSRIAVAALSVVGIIVTLYFVLTVPLCDVCSG